jgi:hypothetical protein
MARGSDAGVTAKLGGGASLYAQAAKVHTPKPLGTPSCGAIQPIEMDNREKNHNPGRGVPKGS